MRWGLLKWKLRSIFKNDYYCYGCCEKSHRAPISFGLIQGFIGVAISLGLGVDVNKEVMIHET